MRGGRMLRFAEADTDSASAFRLCASNTAEPAGGAGRIQSLRAFRQAHLRARRSEHETEKLNLEQFGRGWNN